MIDELLAKDEVSAMFNAAWLTADWPSDLFPNGIPAIAWEGRDSESSPPVDEPYVRFSFTPTQANQSTLADDKNRRKWGNVGIISVQCLGPLAAGNGYEVAEYMAIMAKRVYQGKASPNGMWFRYCRANRIGPSGGWYQFNTIIDFQYDELR